MDKNKQRIAIAEACGWKKFRGCYIPRDELLVWNKPYEPTQSSCGFNLPDYCNDLNAMHEAEQVICRKGNEQIDKYFDQLHKMKVPWIFLATAAQRAEAFLKTIGKWEESK